MRLTAGMAASRVRSILACGAAVLGVLAGAAPATAGETLFKAQFVCNDRGSVYPLAGARVELWKRGLDELPKWVTDSRVAVAQTDAEGRVAVRVRGPEDDFYFRIQLSGGGVRAEDWWAPWAWYADTPTNQNDVPVQDYRVQGLGDGRVSPECAAFEGVRRAYADYRRLTGRTPPYGDLLVKVNSPSAGVPFVAYTRIHWPPRKAPGTEPGGFETATHEFAHTVRHAFDGDSFHFFLDVGRFEYLKHHGPCKRTNPGFAFNEGWAAYWARDYAPAPKCEGIPPDDYAVEGNVAAALTALERYCEGVGRPQMVDVLRRNRGRIHSFADFRQALGCRPLQGPVEGLHRHQEPLSRAALLRAARHQLAALDRTVVGVRSRLSAAERAARRPAPCSARPCVGALQRAVLPPLLRGELAQARLLRRTLAVQASAGGLRRLGRPQSRRFQQRLAARAAAFRTGSARIGRQAAQAALAAARPVLRRDPGAGATAVVRRLHASVRAFSAGRVPAGFALATPGAVAPVTHDPPPAPSPTPPEPAPPAPPAPNGEQPPSPSPPADEPPPPALPDLVVDRVYAYFNEGVGFEVRVDVRNAGAAPAAATKTGITPHGHPEALVATPPLAPGESATLSTPCPYGTPSATARADATDAVAESDETNNGRASSPTGIFCRFP